MRGFRRSRGSGHVAPGAIVLFRHTWAKAEVKGHRPGVVIRRSGGELAIAPCGTSKPPHDVYYFVAFDHRSQVSGLSGDSYVDLLDIGPVQMTSVEKIGALPREHWKMITQMIADLGESLLPGMEFE